MTGRHKDGGMEEGGRGEVSLRYICLMHTVTQADRQTRAQAPGAARTPFNTHLIPADYNLLHSSIVGERLLTRVLSAPGIMVCQHFLEDLLVWKTRLHLLFQTQRSSQRLGKRFYQNFFAVSLTVPVACTVTRSPRATILFNISHGANETQI